MARKTKKLHYHYYCWFVALASIFRASRAEIKLKRGNNRLKRLKENPQFSEGKPLFMFTS